MTKMVVFLLPLLLKNHTCDVQCVAVYFPFICTNYSELNLPTVSPLCPSRSDDLYARSWWHFEAGCVWQRLNGSKSRPLVCVLLGASDISCPVCGPAFESGLSVYSVIYSHKLRLHESTNKVSNQSSDLGAKWQETFHLNESFRLWRQVSRGGFKTDEHDGQEKKTTNWNTNRVIVSLQHQAEAASIDIKGKDKNTSNRLWKPVATDLAFIKTHASSSAVWIYKQIITPHNVVQSTATQQNINLLVLGCLIRRRFEVHYLSWAQRRQWRGNLQWSRKQL